LRRLRRTREEAATTTTTTLSTSQIQRALSLPAGGGTDGAVLVDGTDVDVEGDDGEAAGAWKATT
jgi:hypothetical protein